MLRNPLSRAALAGIAFPLAILACGGKGVTIGSNSEELKSVEASAVSGTVSACAAGAAHPNVCCKGGPNQASECVAYVNSPFHQCGGDYPTTYPNPTDCCDLNDPSKCAPPPPPPPGGGGGTCAYACAPGYWPVENIPGQCCTLLPDKNELECTQVAWAEPVTVGCGYAEDGGVVDAGPPVPDPGPPIDGGPAPDAEPGDGGVIDGGPYPPPPPPPPPPPDCDAGPPVPPPPPWPQPWCNTPCPPGFTPLPGDPSVCCGPAPVPVPDPSGGGSGGSGGGTICFSQAVGPASPPTPVQGGTGGGAPGSTGGGTGSGGTGK